MDTPEPRTAIDHYELAGRHATEARTRLAKIPNGPGLGEAALTIAHAEVDAILALAHYTAAHAAATGLAGSPALQTAAESRAWVEAAGVRLDTDV